MKVDRKQRIINLLSMKHVLMLDELCSMLNVSISTLRRDINDLYDEKKVEKIYGGIRLPENGIPSDKGDFDQKNTIPSFYSRNIRNSYEKIAVAKKAASFIEDDDVIFVDTGTSTVPIIDFISDRKNVTIITNSVYVLYKSLQYPSLNVFGLPGVLKHKTASLTGDACMATLSSYNKISKTFMACTGISIEHGATNSTFEEAVIKRHVVEQSITSFLLSDSTKFNNAGLITFANVNNFNYIITDSMPVDEFVNYCRNNEVELVISPYDFEFEENSNK